VQFLRNLIEKQRTLYHAKDSRFHKLWPLFDAFETFLFAPDHRSKRMRVHVRDYVDLKRVMNNVILALVPCLLWAIWNAGTQHFKAVDGLIVDGKMAADGYVLGWLQSLLGAAWLVITGVGSWRVMLAGVIGLVGMGYVMQMILPASLGGPLTLNPFDHLLVGGFLFGVVFMATDPVSSPETNRGKWIYGILIGVVTWLVRAINPAYPEGTMLSILLLNAFAPTIDHFVVSANIKRRLARA
jgi:Na+-transporting NADH:ubiquinone oxidoreductase subunit NqrB